MSSFSDDQITLLKQVYRLQPRTADFPTLTKFWTAAPKYCKAHV